MSDAWFPTFRRLLGTRIPLPLPSFRPGYTTASQRRGLLRIIAVGIEEKLPLVPLLEAWSVDERGAQKRRIVRLVALLKGGMTLADAVEEVPGLLRDEDVLAIRFDAQSGTQTAAMRESLAESRPVLTGRPAGLRNNFLYFGAVLLLVFPVVAFVQIKIIPEFEKILEEFNMEPPDVMRWSVGLANFVANAWWLWLLLIVIVLWFVFSAWPGRFVRYTLLGRFFQPMRELRSADVLRKIGIATSAGRPIPAALSTMARYHFDPTTRHKLLFVRNEVEQGADVWQSMSAVELITPPEMRVLNTAERVGNRGWVLKQLANAKGRRTLRRLDRMSELLLPVTVVALGMFVLFQALTTLMPLIELITSLA